jgi:hypothetical protein
MDMSFFVSCPITGGLSVPRKSGNTRNADLTSIPHGGWCPDLSGPAGVLRRGHETKKDMSMLSCAQFLRRIMVSAGQDCDGLQGSLPVQPPMKDVSAVHKPCSNLNPGVGCTPIIDWYFYID